MRQPVIGITGRHAVRKGEIIEFVNKGHTSALRTVRGIPVVLPLYAEEMAAARYVDIVDALVLSEGADINPALYGQKQQSAFDWDDVKDAAEMTLLRSAMDRKIPVLGICRGAQMLNVFRGGTVYQDIVADYTAEISHRLLGEAELDCWHYVDIEPNTRLAEIYGETRLRVNSIHHQGINTIGTGLRVCARACRRWVD